MEENTNYRCIVCKAEFLTRADRNEHLETHFIHRNCKNCTRPVIVIGDLEFELHHPTHCSQSQLTYNESDEILQPDNNKCDVDDIKYDEEGINIESSCKLQRTRSGTRYNELASLPQRQKVKATRRTIRNKTNKKTNKPDEIELGNTNESNLDEEWDKCQKAVSSESEDDVIKEMDAMKKRRRYYAKLPKTVPCNVCEAKFGTERTLKIHMNQVHGIKERYICPICSREFKISGNLKQHIETHSDYKRFICNYCGKGFHLPYNLKEHMNTHTGAR